MCAQLVGMHARQCHSVAGFTPSLAASQRISASAPCRCRCRAPGRAKRGRQRWSGTQTRGPEGSPPAAAPRRPPGQQPTAKGTEWNRVVQDGWWRDSLEVHSHVHRTPSCSPAHARLLASIRGQLEQAGQRHAVPPSRLELGAPPTLQPAATPTCSPTRVASLSSAGSAAAPAATVTSSGESWAWPSSTQHWRTKSRAAGKGGQGAAAQQVEAGQSDCPSSTQH